MAKKEDEANSKVLRHMRKPTEESKTHTMRAQSAYH
jgi:hypothetical protein